MKVFESKFSQEEVRSLDNILQSGELGFGPNVTKFEKEFKPFSEKLFNIATNSASAAAFMIFAYLKEEYGTCDVYTPSLGFTSPAWAAKHFGHNIKWVDVNDNLLFDSEDYQDRRMNDYYNRTSENKVVLMPILYGGVSQINEWNILGDELIVVDSAHCVTPTMNYDFAFFSFHPYKPICSSDGGMISTNYEKAANYFQSYRNFGRYNILDSYDIIQEGFKFYMNNLNASIALISQKNYHKNLETRKETFNFLKNEYELLEHDANSSYYFATSLIDNANEINKKYNLARHYPMLHKTAYFANNTTLTNLERLHDKIINLPLWKLL